MTLNITLHLLFVVAATIIFMFVSLFNGSSDYEEDCKKLDNLDFTNTTRIILFGL